MGHGVPCCAGSLPRLVGHTLPAAACGGAEDVCSAALRAHVDATSGVQAAAAGLAFMVFVLLYTPCMAAVAAERHELGSKWMWLSLLGQLAIAWVVALAVFQVGRLLGGG